jgi:small subunit ribosomal protein S8
MFPRSRERRLDPWRPQIIMVNDPISDFLVRLQNASMARKTELSLPFSKMKLAIADVLAKEGYVTAIDKRALKSHNMLSMELAYKNGQPVITGVKRISKPSRRMYMGVHEIRPVMRGHGLLVLSTPAGILTGKQAREKKVGGEALFQIW